MSFMAILFKRDDFTKNSGRVRIAHLKTASFFLHPQLSCKAPTYFLLWGAGFTPCPLMPRCYQALPLHNGDVVI